MSTSDRRKETQPQEEGDSLYRYNVNVAKFGKRCMMTMNAP